MPVQRRRSTKTFTSKESIEGGFGSLKNFVKVKPQRGRRRKRRAEAEQLASGATDKADIIPASKTRLQDVTRRRQVGHAKVLQLPMRALVTDPPPISPEDVVSL